MTPTEPVDWRLRRDTGAFVLERHVKWQVSGERIAARRRYMSRGCTLR